MLFSGNTCNAATLLMGFSAKLAERARGMVAVTLSLIGADLVAPVFDRPPFLSSLALGALVPSQFSSGNARRRTGSGAEGSQRRQTAGLGFSSVVIAFTIVNQS